LKGLSVELDISRLRLGYVEPFVILNGPIVIVHILPTFMNVREVVVYGTAVATGTEIVAITGGSTLPFTLKLFPHPLPNTHFF